MAELSDSNNVVIYSVPVHSVSGCTLTESTSTVFCIYPDDGSKKRKHVTEFLILITNIYCCVID